MTKKRMRIAAFSDWHVQPIEPLVDLFKSKKPDLVLYGGDATERFAPLDHSMITDFDTVKKNILRRPGDLERWKKGVLGSRGGTRYFWYPNVTEERFRAILEGGRARGKEGVYLYKGTKEQGECVYLERYEPQESFFEKYADSARFGLGAVIGNECSLLDKTCLIGGKITDLHENPMVCDWLGVMGLQGAPIKDPDDVRSLQYDEQVALDHLEQQWSILEQRNIKRTILVTHAPPEGALDFALRFSEDNIGSKAVDDFIKRHSVDLVICGHCHYCGGLFSRVGETIVLNIASHDDSKAEGRLAWLIISEEGMESINGAREVACPIDWNGLYNLPQVGKKRLRELVFLGVTSLSDISEENRVQLTQASSISNGLVTRWIKTIEALSEGNAYRLPHADWARIYEGTTVVYDIETDLKGTPWLIGIWDPMDGSVRQFFSPKSEEKLLSEFFSFIERLDDHVLVSFSSSRYDKRCISNSAERNNLAIPLLVNNEIDLGILVGHYTIGLPRRNLKGLAGHYGYEWTSQELSGLDVGRLVSMHFRGGEEPDWELILQYNRDDVYATKLVLEEVLKLEETE